MNYLTFAVRTARDTFTYSPTIDPRTIQIEGLTISRDVMPHHFIARAIILDLQPSQMVAAIAAVETAIKRTYPLAYRIGWRAASDGLTIYFTAWQSGAATAA